MFAESEAAAHPWKRFRLKRREENATGRPARVEAPRSHFRGVHWSKTGWVASICCENKQRYVGVFDTAEKAAKAYDKIARELGLERRCNFDEQGVERNPHRSRKFTSRSSVRRSVNDAAPQPRRTNQRSRLKAPSHLEQHQQQQRDPWAYATLQPHHFLWTTPSFAPFTRPYQPHHALAAAMLPPAETHVPLRHLVEAATSARSLEPGQFTI